MFVLVILHEAMTRTQAALGVITTLANHAKTGSLTNEQTFDMCIRAGELITQARYHQWFQVGISMFSWFEFDSCAK